MSSSAAGVPAGTLYLIPTTLGDEAPELVLPPLVLERVRSLTTFVAEEPKSLRAWLKRCQHPMPLQSIAIATFNEHSREQDVAEVLKPLIEGRDVGVVSEAGVPCVADPGSKLVAYAHAHGLKVVPMVGPSSMLLALMASGLNGQSFEMVGYLPVEPAVRARALRALEAEAKDRDQTKIFIETPYRSDKMLESILEVLSDDTVLSVSRSLFQSQELIRTASIASWKAERVALGKEPCVFLIAPGHR